jgi:hypothetical protein
MQPAGMPIRHARRNEPADASALPGGRPKEADMPQILVVADTSESESLTVQLREWVAPELLDSEHYSAQLLERVRWATEDAEEIERRRAGTAQ